MDNENLNFIGLATSGTFGVAWLARTLWRRIARDGAEVAKDRVEVNILDSLQRQMTQLIEENAALRKREAELERRTGRLEYREEEAIDARAVIARMESQLIARETIIENLVKTHSNDITEMTSKLQSRDEEIKNLRARVAELERKLQASDSIQSKD